MLYSYPLRYTYLYSLPDHPTKKAETAFKYLSIRKVAKYIKFSIGEIIFLYYRKNENTPPGIIGICKVAGEITRVRDIPKEEREFCHNRTYMQLPVNYIQCGIDGNLLDEDILYALPCMNVSYRKLRIYSDYNLIEMPATLLYNLEAYQSLWFIWRAERSETEVRQYKELWVHQLREQIGYKEYLKLSEHITQCHKCGFKHNLFEPYTPRFFEFHEVGIPPLGKYKKIAYSNFIDLCPNCHKEEHEKIVTQSFTDQSRRYNGFSNTGLWSGWNPE